MFSFLTALFTLLPQIFSFVKFLVKLVQDESDKAAKKDLAKKFVDSAHKAVDTGDTGDMEAIFRSGNT